MGCAASADSHGQPTDSEGPAHQMPALGPQTAARSAEEEGVAAAAYRAPKPAYSAAASSSSLHPESPAEWTRAGAQRRNARGTRGRLRVSTPNAGAAGDGRAAAAVGAVAGTPRRTERRRAREPRAHAPPPTPKAQPSAPVMFTLGNVLARGESGLVYLALNQATGSLMVAKALDLETARVDVKALFNEVRLLRELRHPNIVSYIGTQVHDNVAFIFTDWVSGGSLRSLLQRFGPLEEDLVRRYACHILSGLQHLHDRRVVHGNIKPDNLLVDSCGTVKVADFGASRRVASGQRSIRGTKSCGVARNVRQILGTPHYMSPEAATGRCADARPSDVWALGCTLLELASGAAPWSQLHIDDTATLIRHIGQARTAPPLPHGLPPGLYHLLSCCLCVDPMARATVGELLAHPWLSTRHDEADGSGQWAPVSAAESPGWGRLPRPLPPVHEPPSVADASAFPAVGGAVAAPSPMEAAAAGVPPPPVPTAAAASAPPQVQAPAPAVPADDDDDDCSFGDRVSNVPTTLHRHASAIDLSRRPRAPWMTSGHRGSVTDPEDEDDTDPDEVVDVFGGGMSTASGSPGHAGASRSDRGAGIGAGVADVTVSVVEGVRGASGQAGQSPSQPFCLSDVMPLHLSAVGSLATTTSTDQDAGW